MYTNVSAVAATGNYQLFILQSNHWLSYFTPREGWKRGSYHPPAVWDNHPYQFISGSSHGILVGDATHFSYLNDLGRNYSYTIPKDSKIRFADVQLSSGVLCLYEDGLAES